MPGGILALSSNGIAGALLWSNEAFGNLPGDPAANLNPTPNILRAYDASTAGTGSLQAIWDSEAEPNDHVGANEDIVSNICSWINYRRRMNLRLKRRRRMKENQCTGERQVWILCAQHGNICARHFCRSRYQDPSWSPAVTRG
jgi:hypothetical protein